MNPLFNTMVILDKNPLFNRSDVLNEYLQNGVIWKQF